MLPTAHRACSATMEYWFLSNSQKIGMPPLSIMVCVYKELPEATFVKAQADSSCKWGCCSAFINSMRGEMRLASMIGWMGGISIDNRTHWEHLAHTNHTVVHLYNVLWMDKLGELGQLIQAIVLRKELLHLLLEHRVLDMGIFIDGADLGCVVQFSFVFYQGFSELERYLF